MTVNFNQASKTKAKLKENWIKTKVGRSHQMNGEKKYLKYAWKVCYIEEIDIKGVLKRCGIVVLYGSPPSTNNDNKSGQLFCTPNSSGVPCLSETNKGLISFFIKLPAFSQYLF